MVPLLSPSVLGLVALGGAAGALCRHVTQVLAVRAFGAAFPWGTLGINVAGSLAMGLVAALLLDRHGLSRASLFLMSGVLGGFTTYSTFSLETLRLVEGGEPARAAAYALASLCLTVGGCWAGLSIGRAL